MKGTHLGEFEELILLMVGILYDQAYGVAILRAFETHTVGLVDKIGVSTRTIVGCIWLRFALQMG